MVEEEWELNGWYGTLERIEKEVCTKELKGTSKEMEGTWKEGNKAWKIKVGASLIGLEEVLKRTH